MVVLPTKFQSVTPSTITGFTFADKVQGIGYIEYFPATASPDKNVLSPAIIYSNEETTSATVAGSADFTAANDIDFDIIVAQPATLKGTLIANIPVAARGGGSGSTNTLSRITITISRFDGSTETSIGSNVGTERSYGNISANSDTGGSVDCIEVEIATATRVKAGEFIRISVLQEEKSATGTAIHSFGHDPQNRNDSSVVSGFSTGDVTKASIQIPFRLELG